MASNLGTNVVIKYYIAYGNSFEWVFEDGSYAGGDAEIIASESLTFTGDIWIDNEQVIFNSPYITFDEQLGTTGLGIAGGNNPSLTLKNAIVNFDNAVFDADEYTTGELIFDNSKLKLTENSIGKQLIKMGKISGTITLDLDESFVSGSSFTIKAHTENNLIINNAEGYEVIPTTDGTITTYTVNYIKEIQKISNKNETYRLKDTIARKRLNTVDEKIDEFFHTVKELNDTVNNFESGLDEKLEKTMISNCILKTSVSVPISLFDGKIHFRNSGSFQIVPHSDGKTEIESMSDFSYSGEDGKLLVFTKSNTGVVFVSPNDCSSGEDMPYEADWKIFYLDQYGSPDNDFILGFDKDAGFLSGYSYPIAEVTAKDNKIVSIDSIFTHCSYIDSYIIVYGGLKALLPTGRYEDGSLRTWEVNSSLNVIKVSGTRSLSYIAIGISGELEISDEISSGNTYYDREANVFYLNKEDRGGNYVPIGTFACVDGHITEFHPKSAIKLAEEGETAVQPDNIPVKDVQANGTSILTDGVANIPLATSDNPGLVRPVHANGIYVSNTGTLNLSKLSNAGFENKTANYAVLVNQIDLATKVGVTTNTIELTDEEKANACNWVGAGQKRTTVIDSTTPTVTIDNALSNTDYQYGTITSLTITAVENSYLETNFFFTAGSEITVDLPDTLKIIGSPSFEANKQYAMSICNNTLIVGLIS